MKNEESLNIGGVSHDWDIALVDAGLLSGIMSLHWMSYIMIRATSVVLDGERDYEFNLYKTMRYKSVIFEQREVSLNGL